jgi:phage terminase large subunit GpA-like protein
VGREYFEQLTSEYLKTEYRHGRPVRRWARRSDRRQPEALDCAVYSMAALAALQASGGQLDSEAARMALLAVSARAPAEPARYEQTRNKWARM